ncbi:MAG TPA: ribosome maturation factor RimM [Candidatus Limnocylindrales bacterium]|nr:ribosome maturation factor RimM [Candidatus Limnocylindrales bacterium]
MTSQPAEPALRVGRVLKVHGLDGAVRVESLTDFPDRFRKGAQLDAAGRRLTIAAAVPGDGVLIVRFAEIADRTAASALQGAYLTVPLEDARTLPADRFYHFQLVGLQVVKAQTGEPLGRVAEVLEYPANDVLRVTAGAAEVLVPMVRGIVQSIDLERGRIVVDLLEEE